MLFTVKFRKAYNSSECYVYKVMMDNILCTMIYGWKIKWLNIFVVRGLTEILALK